MMFFRNCVSSVIAIGSVVFSCVVGCVASSDLGMDGYPETCADVQEAAVDETGDRPANGMYTLYVEGDESQPWDAYCHDMKQASPIEFLDVIEEDNYSQIRNENVGAETSYRRYRIDPIRLELWPLDDTFATNSFEDFTPAFPRATLESIPAGWAEFQPINYNQGLVVAKANVSLKGTAFMFDEAVEDDGFFCQVDSVGTMSIFTEGTGFEVSNDLTGFNLTAININSEEQTNVWTREVADCASLGPNATTFTEAAWPLAYAGE